MNKIILASKSPRRIELLQMCGLDFSSLAADIDEGLIKSHILADSREESTFDQAKILTERLAREKALHVYRQKKTTMLLDQIHLLLPTSQSLVSQ